MADFSNHLNAQELFIPRVTFHNDGSGNLTATIQIPNSWVLDEERISSDAVLGITIHYARNGHLHKRRLRQNINDDDK